MSGMTLTPRSEDTPRTKQRKDLASKRLAYFSSHGITVNSQSSNSSSSKPAKNTTNTTPKGPASTSELSSLIVTGTNAAKPSPRTANGAKPSPRIKGSGKRDEPSPRSENARKANGRGQQNGEPSRSGQENGAGNLSGRSDKTFLVSGVGANRSDNLNVKTTSPRNQTREAGNLPYSLVRNQSPRTDKLLSKKSSSPRNLSNETANENRKLYRNELSATNSGESVPKKTHSPRNTITDKSNVAQNSESPRISTKPPPGSPNKSNPLTKSQGNGRNRSGSNSSIDFLKSDEFKELKARFGSCTQSAGGEKMRFNLPSADEGDVAITAAPSYLADVPDGYVMKAHLNNQQPASDFRHTQESAYYSAEKDTYSDAFSDNRSIDDFSKHNMSRESLSFPSEESFGKRSKLRSNSIPPIGEPGEESEFSDAGLSTHRTANSAPFSPHTPKTLNLGEFTKVYQPVIATPKTEPLGETLEEQVNSQISDTRERSVKSIDLESENEQDLLSDILSEKDLSIRETEKAIPPVGIVNSRDFELNRNISIHKENIQSVMENLEDIDNRDSFDYTNLKAVLGKEKFDRLMHNFDVADMFSDVEQGKSAVAHNLWASMDSSEIQSKVEAAKEKYQYNENHSTEDSESLQRSADSSDNKHKFANLNTKLSDDKMHLNHGPTIPYHLEQVSYSTYNVQGKGIPVLDNVNSTQPTEIAQIKNQPNFNPRQTLQEPVPSKTAPSVSNFTGGMMSRYMDDLQVPKLALDSVDASQNFAYPTSTSIMDDDLGLHTHRPQSEVENGSVIANNTDRQNQNKWTSVNNPQNSVDRSIAAANFPVVNKDAVKYAYSVDEIYAQAREIQAYEEDDNSSRASVDTAEFVRDKNSKQTALAEERGELPDNRNLELYDMDEDGCEYPDGDKPDAPEPPPPVVKKEYQSQVKTSNSQTLNSKPIGIPGVTNGFKEHTSYSSSPRNNISKSIKEPIQTKTASPRNSASIVTKESALKKTASPRNSVSSSVEKSFQQKTASPRNSRSTSTKQSTQHQSFPRQSENVEPQAAQSERVLTALQKASLDSTVVERSPREGRRETHLGDIAENPVLQPQESIGGSPQIHYDRIKEKVEDRSRSATETDSQGRSQYTNPSLERYFTSIEVLGHDQASMVSTDTFEPVPEPEIDITPRHIAELSKRSSENSNRNVGLSISGAKVQVGDSCPVAGKGKASSKDSPRIKSSTKKNKPATSGLVGSQNSPRQSTGDNTRDSEKLTNSSLKASTDPVRRENVSTTFSPSLNNVEAPYDDDDLFTKVTSLVSEMESEALPAKLKELGIDFSFLKSQNSENISSKPSEETITSQKSKTAKVCPACVSVNNSTSAECFKCKKSLLKVLPVPMKPISGGTTPRDMKSKSSAGASRFTSRLEQSMKDDSHTGRSNKGRKEERKFQKKVESMGNFQYGRDEEIARGSIPKHIKSQLSLDVRGSTESSLSESKDSKEFSDMYAASKGNKLFKGGSSSTKQINQGDVDSSISIDYSDEPTENVKSSLPQGLRSQLSLNLAASTDSRTTASTSTLKDNDSDRGIEIAFASNSSADDNKNQNNANRSNDSSLAQREDDILNDETLGVIQDDDEEDIAVADSDYKEFLHKLVNDDRFKGKKSPDPRPSTSSGAPSKSKTGGKSKYGSVPSKVRASWDNDPAPRKWQRSSVAWASFNSNELSKPSSTGKKRPSSASSSMESRVAKSMDRPASAGTKRTPLSRPTQPRPAFAQSADFAIQEEDENTTPRIYKDSKLLKAQSLNFNRGQGGGTSNGKYAKLLAMSPRINRGEVSFLTCLPDELLLYIMSYLSQTDLARLMVTCKQLNRVALDESLWEAISLKRHEYVQDDWLAEMGKRKPTSLLFVQCRGRGVTDKGLRELFRQCCDTLQQLTFNSCSHGYLTGDHILLHAASRCHNITHLDASWCNANDNGVIALSETAKRLESLCLNGCQQMSDEAIITVVEKHGASLTTLEFFGCFNITDKAVAAIGRKCPSLVTLNLGQCWKITDRALAQLAQCLGKVENLDLRGCKQLSDGSARTIIVNSPLLKTLSLANSPSLTNAILLDVATYCPNLQSLDMCGCKNVDDVGVRAIANTCKELEYIDLSSTSITHKSISTLASYCNDKLQVLKINYCKHISVPSLVRLAKNCTTLRKLYLYGVNNMRSIDEVRSVNADIWIEMENPSGRV